MERMICDWTCRICHLWAQEELFPGHDQGNVLSTVAASLGRRDANPAYGSTLEEAVLSHASSLTARRFSFLVSAERKLCLDTAQLVLQAGHEGIMNRHISNRHALSKSYARLKHESATSGYHNLVKGWGMINCAEF